MEEPEEARARDWRRRPAALLGALLVMLVVVSCSSPETPGTEVSADRGPLSLPDGHQVLLAPSKDRGFFTIPACVEETGEMQLEIKQVAALRPWADAEVTWKITWPPKDRPVLVGSAYGTAPRRFVDLPSKGVAEPCRIADDSPVLAVEFPRAESEHLGFDGLRVHYTADGESYQADYDVSFGICAKGVSDPGAL